jgi:hypothetical protein
MWEMLKGLFGLTALLPKIVDGTFSWLNKKQDTAVVQNNNAASVSSAIVQSETARNADVKDIALVMMSHPIFWVAWGLGVFPVLAYHAAIYFVSTIPALGWTVLKVPDIELAYGDKVVGSVFMLTGASTVVAALTHAWTKRA